MRQAVAHWGAEVAGGVKRERWLEMERGRRKKCLREYNVHGYVRGFWIAEPHSGVAGRDADRTARQMPNGPAKTGPLRFCLQLSFSSFPRLSFCLLFPSSLTLFQCFIYPFMSSCIIHAAFTMNSLLHIQFFISAYFLSCCLSPSVCVPPPLSNSWHSILPAE